MLSVKRKAKSAKLKIKNCDLCVIVLLSVFFIFNLAGCKACQTVKEAAKCYWGVSTQVLEDGRKDAIRKTFPCNEKACYDNVKLFLSRSGPYIYAADPKKGMVAVYFTAQDTTPVGVFCKSIDANNTEIQVSSPSTFAKETIAKRVFTAMGKRDELDTEKGSADAQK